MTLSLAPTPAPTTSAEAHEQLGELIFLNRNADARAGHTASVSGTIRVVVADGQALVRAGFRVLLEGEQGIAVAGEAASGEETVALARHIKPDGVIAFHVTNRYLDLVPVVAALAAAHDMQAVWIHDEGEDALASRSDWVLVSNNRKLLEQPRIAEAASEITAHPEWRLWTDDFNNLFQVLRR